MRYIHDATLVAKNRFVNQLSFIIEKITQDGVTQRELADVAKVSPGVIGKIKHGHVKGVSFAVMKRVADALKLEYTITISSRLGVATQEVTVQSGYEYMKLAKVWNNTMAETQRVSH